MTGCLETLLEHSRAQYLDLLDQLRELADESGPEQIERLLEQIGRASCRGTV